MAMVAPLAGAWIEIMFLMVCLVQTKGSLLSRERGLK